MKIALLLLLISASALSTVTIHKRTENFIDIEVDKADFWISCTDYPEDNISLLGFNVFDGDNGYLFYYRRPRNIKQCHEEERQYRKMMDGEKTVRIVGTGPREETTNPKYKFIKGIPERFTNTKKEIGAVFVRMQVKAKCKSYFPNDCEFPKAGVMPK